MTLQRLFVMSLAVLPLTCRTTAARDRPQMTLQDLARRLDEAEAEIKRLQESLSAAKLPAPSTPAAPGVAASPPPEQQKLPEWTQRLTVDGRAFIRASYELDGANEGFNEVDIDRIYLGFTWALSQKLKARLVLEGGDLRDSDYKLSGTSLVRNDGNYFDLTTKTFHLEVKDPLHQGSFLRFGQTELPWVSFEDGLWGHRVQGTTFADRSGYLTSTDLGVAVGGTIPKGYGSWQANLANGEGWKKNEMGNHKDVHARVTVNPLAASKGRGKNFFFSAFASAGTYDDVAGDADDRERMIAQVGYKEPGKWTLVAEHLWATDPADKLKGRHPSLAARPGELSNAAGWSAFSTINLSTFGSGEGLDDWELIVRMDHLDPDDEIDRNSLSRYILGISRRWNKHVATLLALERVDHGSGAMVEDESRATFHVELKY